MSYCRVCGSDRYVPGCDRPGCPQPKADAPLTAFMCGPSKCEHDYHSPAAKWVEYQNPGGSWTGTAVCSKCGAHAVDEAMWRDDF